MEDHEIVELYCVRSEQAIQETAAKYGAYCRSIALRILDSPEDSDECVNDTYLRAWNAIPPHHPENLATFLGKITRNLAIDRRDRLFAVKRGRGQMDNLLDELRTCLPGSDHSEWIIDELVLTQVMNCFLDGLAPLARKIFLLRYWYAYSVREIARRLGVGESRVKMSLLRSRNSLKKTLEKEEIGL